MLDVKPFSDGCMSYAIACDNCGKECCTTYSEVSPYAAANMVSVNGSEVCADCARDLYDIDVKG